MTSLISLEQFVEENKDKSYRELLQVRDELFEKIHEYENTPAHGLGYPG